MSLLDENLVTPLSLKIESSIVLLPPRACFGLRKGGTDGKRVFVLLVVGLGFALILWEVFVKISICSFLSFLSAASWSYEHSWLLSRTLGLWEE